MRTFWGIVPRYIIKKKSKILFMAMGIVLSISLACMVSLLKDALTANIYNNAWENTGERFDYRFETPKFDVLKSIENSDTVEVCTMKVPVGYCKFDELGKNIEIYGYDNNFNKFINYKLIEGRYAEKDGEITLEDSFFSSLQGKYKIGDKISFKVNYNGANTVRDMEFTIVGSFLYNRNYVESTVGLQGFVTRDYAEKTMLTKNVKNSILRYKGYLNMKKRYDDEKGFLLLTRNIEGEDIKIEDDYFTKRSEGTIVTLKIIVDFIYFIILAITTVVIYNIFNNSVIERKKEIGMMRAIGAGAKRIQLMVLLEGILVGALFIAAGMILGDIIGKMVINNMFKKVVVENFKPELKGYIKVAILAMVSVLLGSYFPARRASNIMPMEAIREDNSESINYKYSLELESHKKRRGKFTALLAMENIKRNKRRFISSSLSLILTIVMLMSTIFLLTSLTAAKKGIKAKNIDEFIITSNDGESLNKSVVESVGNAQNINITTKYQYPNIYDFMCDTELLSKDGLNYNINFLNSKHEEKAIEVMNKNKMTPLLSSVVYSYEENSRTYLKDTVQEGNVDSIFMDNKDGVITIGVVQNLNYHDYTRFKVGDTVNARCNQGGKINEYIFKIGCILNEDALVREDGKIRTVFIINQKNIAETFPKYDDYEKIGISFDNSKNMTYDEAENKIKTILKEQGVDNIKVESVKEAENKAKMTKGSVFMISMSFILCIVAVSICNLINVMKMNVASRRREIAIMRAIGLGQDEVKQMLKTEGIIYGLVSSVIGCIISFIITLLFYYRFRTAFGGGLKWNIPYLRTFLVCFGTTVIISVTSVVSGRGLFKDSIVESIRTIS